MSYARVIVERDAIDKGDPNPIRLEWVSVVGTVHVVGRGSSVRCTGDVEVIYSPDAPLADGTRVWVQADSAYIVAAE